VLRYWGDVTADWNGAPSADPVTFQGPVVALAIVDDEPTGGVFTLFLQRHGQCTVNAGTSGESGIVDLCTIDHHMRVRVGRDRELALADEASNLGP
jgi:hypothetical protein